MRTINFSHRYKKMPEKINPTFLNAVDVAHYQELEEDFIKYDTETIDGSFYPFSKTKLLILRLWTEGEEWTTVRRWTSDKERYYRSLVGQQVRISINKENKHVKEDHRQDSLV